MEQLVTLILAFILTIFFTFGGAVGLIVAAKTTDGIGEFFMAWIVTSLFCSIPGFIFLGLFALL